MLPPSDISRTKPLVRLVLNQIGRRLTEDLHAKDRRHRLLMMLDEFPALGRLDFFKSALAFMAGYQIKAFLIVQSLNQIGKAYVTATVTVWDADPRIADEKLRLAEKVIQSHDFTAIVETVNAIEAWMGGIPGHVYANVRQPPISTLNLAHMMPLSAVWAGPKKDEHLDAPPLFYAKTEGAPPFRFSLHVGDVGHAVIVDPTGAGKSVLLALMALQFRRYERSRVFAFDFGGSIRVATLAMRGDWLVDILTREGVEITPDVKEHLWTALTSLASAPVVERTISGLAALLQANALKQAIRPYCIGGPYGRLLDAEMEWLGDASVQAFETEGLIGTGAAPAVLAYLFHRIESRFDGRPSLLIVDEGWRALDDGGFAQKIKEWLKTLRKKNVSVVFSSQSLVDIEASPIAPVIVESCPTRIFLANERAIEPQIASIYRQFGLNDRQIEIVARAMPKRDYYCQSRRANRIQEKALPYIVQAGTVIAAALMTGIKSDLPGQITAQVTEHV